MKMKAFIAEYNNGEEVFVILSNSLTNVKKRFKKYSIENVGSDLSSNTEFREVTLI